MAYWLVLAGGHSLVAASEDPMTPVPFLGVARGHQSPKVKLLLVGDRQGPVKDHVVGAVEQESTSGRS
jgi:hypothetical protein